MADSLVMMILGHFIVAERRRSPGSFFPWKKKPAGPSYFLRQSIERSSGVRHQPDCCSSSHSWPRVVIVAVSFWNEKTTLLLFLLRLFFWLSQSAELINWFTILWSFYDKRARADGSLTFRKPTGSSNVLSLSVAAPFNEAISPLFDRWVSCIIDSSSGQRVSGYTQAARWMISLHSFYYRQQPSQILLPRPFIDFFFPVLFVCSMFRLTFCSTHMCITQGTNNIPNQFEIIYLLYPPRPQQQRNQWTARSARCPFRSSRRWWF